MAARLNARQDARKVQVSENSAADLDSNARTQKVTEFFRNFHSEQKKLESRLESWKKIDATTLSAHFDSLSQALSALRESLTSATIYLSSFESQTYQATIDRLYTEIETARNEAIPKKKFSFASSKKKTASIAAVDTTPHLTTKSSTLTCMS